MQRLIAPSESEAPSAVVLPRLLPHQDVRTLPAFIEHFGERPRGTRALIHEVERAGLRGHGGAGFPTATKMHAVAERRRRGCVVVNATEGEPMSSKDKALCSAVPHLVLDGAVLAAEAIHAREVIVCGDRAAPSTLMSLGAAIAERSASGREHVDIRLEAAPNRYVAGEESALVHWLNGSDAKPTFVPPRPFERGVNGRPTLVQNAETLAHLALVARFGARWFRGLGTAADPGSSLVTVAGAVATPGVYEIPLGFPLAEMLRAADGDIDATRAVLVGGYFGSWLTPAQARGLTLDATTLASAGASFGCGVLVAVPDSVCGLAESASVAHWLADENAGQCGPCANGLPAIASAMRVLVAGDRDHRAEAALHRWIGMVKGRGACKHPDGVARFVATALVVFAHEIELHRSRRCTRRHDARLLATPRPGGWR
jgi:NADH:ubiquinone oxidoreductase subunit F (NADH-binding)